MVDNDRKCQFVHEDETGKYRLYPVTKADCVEGLKDFVATPHMVRVNLTWDEETGEGIYTTEAFNWDKLLSAVKAGQNVFCRIYNIDAEESDGFTITNDFALSYFSDEENCVYFDSRESVANNDIHLIIYSDGSVKFGQKRYVRTINGITPDENGNVEIERDSSCFLGTLYDFSTMSREQMLTDWSVTNEDASNWEHVQGEGLKIKSQRNGLYGGNSDCKNIFMLPVSGNFLAEVKVTMNQIPNENWQQFALLSLTDQENYVKMKYGFDGELGWQILAETGGVPGVSYGAGIKWEPTTVWMRLKRLGNTFIGYCSTDGVGFRQLGEPISVEGLDATHIGLAAYNDSGTDSQVEFTVEYVQIETGGTEENADMVITFDENLNCSHSFREIWDALQDGRIVKYIRYHGYTTDGRTCGFVFCSYIGNEENALWAGNLYASDLETGWRDCEYVQNDNPHFAIYQQSLRVDELEDDIGDISTALDSIIEMQKAICGLIAFTIDGVTYYAVKPEGSSADWPAWLTSSYNTLGVYRGESDSKLYTPDGGKIYNSAGEHQTAWADIEDEGVYTIRYEEDAE